MYLLDKFEEKYILKPKFLYIVLNLQYFAMHQFRGQFATEEYKISPNQYGKMTGIIMFITFFTNIGIGEYADKMKKPKLLMVFLLAITTLILMCLLVNNYSQSIAPYVFWTGIFFYLLFNTPKQPLLDKVIIDYLADCIPGGSNYYGSQRLWGTVAYAASNYIVEWSITVEHGKPYDFKRLIPYLLITTVLAIVGIYFVIPSGSESHEGEKQPKKEVLEANKNNESDSKKENKTKEENENEEQNLEASDNAEDDENNIVEQGWMARIKKSGYYQLLNNSEYMIFILIMFSNAVTRAAMAIYLSIYHRDVLKVKPYDLPDTWPRWMQSLVEVLNQKPITAIMCFGLTFEILGMYMSDFIIQRIGLFMPLLIAQIFGLVRFIAYYSIDIRSSNGLGWSCLFELIKGIYFSLAHMSGMQISTKLAPKRLKSTSQMIYQGTFNALGHLVSGWFFGMLFESKLKGSDVGRDSKGDAFRTLFIVNAVITFATILAFFYKYGIKDKMLMDREKEERKLAEGNKQIEQSQITAV